MRVLNRHEPALVAELFLLLAAAVCAGETVSWLGDGGHFLQTSPRMFANNPDGRAFTVTVHRHVWAVGGEINAPGLPIRVLKPDGAEAVAGVLAGGEGAATVAVPAGAKGVYEIEIKTGGYSLVWVQTSLPKLVAVTEPFAGKDVGQRPFQLHVVAPRRWYFHVPRGVRRFRIKHEIQTGQTHREDFGFFVVSPRGQRVEAVFGGKSLEMSPTSGARPGFSLPLRPVAVVRSIEVDPGADGRFWSLWLTSGDSHSYSDLRLQFEGVPPYLASSPEQWFDPRTGQDAPERAYDESLIRHPDTVDAQGELREPYPRYFCTPTPFLGDEDYNGWRGPHTVWISNPEGRKLEFGVQAYLSPPAERKTPVAVRVTGPKGKALIEKALPLGRSIEIAPAGGGTYRVDCDGLRWFPWTFPVTRAVIEGKPADNGGAEFAIETSIPRHWFFKVPSGTRRFTVAVKVHDPNHVLRVEVQSPDRIEEELAVRGGARREMVVEVEPRSQDRIWFLRVEVGSATRFLSDKRRPRQVTIEADIELHGVPGYLAPTWEQWFDLGPGQGEE